MHPIWTRTHCLIVVSVWSFHLNLLNTPFLSVSLFLVMGIYHHLFSATLSSSLYTPCYLFSSVTQNWKYTANSCLQMFLPLFCQQAGYHKNSIIGRAHLPSAPSWQCGMRRNDWVSQTAKHERWDLLGSWCTVFVLPTVPQWAWKMLWSGTSITDESVNEEGSAAVTGAHIPCAVVWMAAVNVMSSFSKYLSVLG